MLLKVHPSVYCCADDTYKITTGSEMHQVASLDEHSEFFVPNCFIFLNLLQIPQSMEPKLVSVTIWTAVC